MASLRKIVTATFLTTILLCDEVIAGLELGPITVLSNRNEPFTAEMDLFGAETISLFNINVQLAPKEQFEKLGVEWHPSLENISFDLKTTATGKSVLLTTAEPVTSSFFRLVVGLFGPNGQSFRDYAIYLVDSTTSLKRSPAKAAPLLTNINVMAETHPFPTITERPAASNYLDEHEEYRVSDSFEDVAFGSQPSSKRMDQGEGTVYAAKSGVVGWQGVNSTTGAAAHIFTIHTNSSSLDVRDPSTSLAIQSQVHNSVLNTLMHGLEILQPSEESPSGVQFLIQANVPLAKVNLPRVMTAALSPASIRHPGRDDTSAKENAAETDEEHYESRSASSDRNGFLFSSATLVSDSIPLIPEESLDFEDQATNPSDKSAVATLIKQGCKFHKVNVSEKGTQSWELFCLKTGFVTVEINPN